MKYLTKNHMNKEQMDVLAAKSVIEWPSPIAPAPFLTIPSPTADWMHDEIRRHRAAGQDVFRSTTTQQHPARLVLTITEE